MTLAQGDARSRQNRATLGRRSFATLSAASALGRPFIARAGETEQLVITQPQHSLSSLPLYVAIRRGCFASEKLDVRVSTVANGAHVAAVLSGQVFAVSAGPDHNALANLRGASLRVVVNLLDRAQVYLVAPPNRRVDAANLAATLGGCVIATGIYGTPPNSIMRYLCLGAGLSLDTDVKLAEGTQAGALGALASGQVQFATVNEPLLTRGIRDGAWAEPFLNLPARFGPYAYGALSVLKTSIDHRPEAVAGLVRGLRRALQAMQDDPDIPLAVARQEFPTTDPDILRAAVQRLRADSIWSTDGRLSEQSWTAVKRVVMAAGLLKANVAYGDVVDMSFINAA